MSYSWDFGDGTTSIDVVASHTYATAGSYTATLTVIDNNGAIAADSVTVSVLAGMADWQGAAPSVIRQSGNTYPFAVDITWNRPIDDGGFCVTEYRVEYGTNGSSVESSQSLTGSPNLSCVGEPATSISWPGLPAGAQTRWFRIVALNSLGPTHAATSPWAVIQMTQTCTLVATEDAWVNEDDPVFGSNYRDDNYGGEDLLNVAKNGNQLYVKFDARPTGTDCEQFPGPLPASAAVAGGGVSLYNHTPTEFERDHRIYRTSSGWSEFGITYYNRPSAVNPTDTETTTSGGWHEWWVNASDIEQQRNASTQHGWNIKDVGGNIFSEGVDYRSRDYSSQFAPRLTVQFY